jgi:hypothetical protein
MFREMSKDGFINLETWISWATEHIAAMMSRLSKVNHNCQYPEHHTLVPKH